MPAEMPDRRLRFCRRWSGHLGEQNQDVVRRLQRRQPTGRLRGGRELPRVELDCRFRVDGAQVQMVEAWRREHGWPSYLSRATDCTAHRCPECPRQSCRCAVVPSRSRRCRSCVARHVIHRFPVCDERVLRTIADVRRFLSAPLGAWMPVMLPPPGNTFRSASGHGSICRPRWRSGYFWPVWPMFGWVFGLAAHGLAARGGAGLARPRETRLTARSGRSGRAASALAGAMAGRLGVRRAR